MRKFIGLSLVAILVVTLVVLALGCAQSTPTPTPTTKPTTAPTATPTAAPTVIKWKGQNGYPQGAKGYSGSMGSEFTKWLNQISDGRLVIDLAEPGAVVAVADMYDAIQKGVLDFAGLYYAGYYSAKMPEADVEIGPPFAWQTPEQWWDGMFVRGIYNTIQPIYNSNNVYWFPICSNTYYGYGCNFVFKSLDDLKGKKIRATAIYGKLVEKLGGSAVVIPHSELYMALKLGTVDGCQTSLNSLRAWNAQEVWKSYTVNPNPNIITGNMIVNLKSWQALPADIRDRIQKFSDDALMRIAIDSHATELTWMGEASTKYGVKFVDMSPADTIKYRDIAMSLWEDIAKTSPKNVQMLEKIREGMKAFGRL